MRTKVLFFIAAFISLNSFSQDKIILVSGDTLTMTIKKLSASAVTLDDNGIEKDLNVNFISRLFRANGTEIALRGFVNKETTIKDISKPGVTNKAKYTEELEAEADAMFADCYKTLLDKKLSQLNDENFYYAVNAFFGLEKETEIIAYSHKVKNTERIVGNSYKLGYYVNASSFEANRHPPYTCIIKGGTYTQYEEMRTLGRTVKLTLKDDEMSIENYFHPDDARFTDKFRIVYIDDNTLRYVRLDRPLTPYESYNLTKIDEETAVNTFKRPVKKKK